MGAGEGVHGCYRCIKYLLVGFNFIVLIIGGAVLGLGIFVLVSDYGVTQMTALLGSDLYKAGVYLLIAAGAVTIVISFFGCCGAVMESRCLLGLYFGVMLILTIFFVALCVIGFVFKDNITGHLKREAETILINDYGSVGEVTDAWDTTQQELKCCGVSGGESSNTSWAIYKLQSSWFKDQDGSGEPQYVPSSCCDPTGDEDVCVGKTDNDNKPPKQGPPLNDSMTTNDHLYTEGCYDQLDDFLERNALIIGGIALAALFIMLLGDIFSICLCMQIGRKGYVV